MRRYFIELVNPDPGMARYLGRTPTEELIEHAGLKKENVAFISYMTDQWGPVGAVFEMLDIYEDAELTLACLKLNGKYVGRTAITEGETFPEWLEGEPTFAAMHFKTRRKK